jgi:hypothetical protein
VFSPSLNLSEDLFLQQDQLGPLAETARLKRSSVKPVLMAN